MTHREALRKGGLAAGGLALVGGAMSGNAAADHGKTGGTMILVGEPQTSKGGKDSDLDPPDTFTHRFTFGFALPASCFASESELEDYRGLEIEYRNGDRQIGAVRTSTDHPTEGTAYVFTSAVECKEPEFERMWKAAFRPA